MIVTAEAVFTIGSEVDDQNQNRSRFLKLSARHFGLWLVLWLMLASKLFLIRGNAISDLYELLIFGPFMLVVAYLGAWLIWRVKERTQMIGEIAYMAILTSVFLARTVFLYREALAGQ